MQETVDGEKSRRGYRSPHPSVSTVVARAVGEKKRASLRRTKWGSPHRIKICR